MKLYEKYKTLFEQYEINTPLRIAHFMTQAEHESGLKAISESLYYKTVERARAMFITPFKGKSDDFVKSYLFNSEKMANYVYSNRGGNGNEASGEGFKYRGRGIFQLTLKENYYRLYLDTGLDVIKNPDLLLEEPNAVISALWFWKTRKLNALADKDDLVGIRKRVNGGKNGLTACEKILKKYKDET